MLLNSDLLLKPDLSPELRRRAEAWLAEDPDPLTRAELAALLASNDGVELADRFRGALEFGTAGLRGVMGAGPNRMNRAVVRRTTLGLARYLKSMVPEVAERGVVIGRDGRKLSDVFARDAAGVFAAEGIPVHYFPEVVPTPLVAFAVTHLTAACGVMVTASHNPPEYNGYKVYWGNGAQIIPPHDHGIAAAIDAAGPAGDVVLLDHDAAKTRGVLRELGPGVGEAYLAGILGLRLHAKDATAVKIVYTAMHGVGGRWMVEALRRAGFERVFPVPQQQEPDGDFPTVRFPNPEEKGAMDLAAALAQRHGADLVLANDPDADRLAVLTRDAHGYLRPLNGNEVGVLLGHYVLTQTKLRSPRALVITSLVSSSQLLDMAVRLGARSEVTLTGFKWIANRALARAAEDGSDFVFGFEEALGYTVGTVVRDKDGIGAGLVFADLAAWCQGRGTSVRGYLEEIEREFGLYISEQKNFTFKGAEGAEVIRAIMGGFRKSPPASISERRVRAMRDYETSVSLSEGKLDTLNLPSSNVIAFDLDGGVRITLRPSGTEPKIKYYFELRETLERLEPLERARARAEERLRVVMDAFVVLARERGQPL